MDIRKYWPDQSVLVPEPRSDTGRGKLIIDRARFRHFAPAELHPYHRNFDFLYRQWLGRELNYEREGIARHRVPVSNILNAIVSGESVFVPVGDPIPVIEMMIEIGPLGQETMKVMPRHLLRPVRPDDWVNGAGKRSTAGENGGIRIRPSLIVQLATLTSDGVGYRGMRRSFGCDLSLVLARVNGRPTGAAPPFTAYCHSFGDIEDEGEPNFIYYGITQRPWQKRWAEHRRSIERGSKLDFHRTFREEMKAGRITSIHHEVVDVAQTRDAIEDVEERLIAGMLSDPYCLNMIPGGKAGLAYMRQNGMLGSREKSISIEKKDRILEDWVQTHSRQGVPAPWVSERWNLDEAWAASFVCAGFNRLSIEQVRAIRRLAAAGTHPDEILKEVGARSLEQVKGVTTGKTYRRVS